MILVGIDPGLTTGWCLYDGDRRRVLAAGQFDSFCVPDEVLAHARVSDGVIVESMENPHGTIYPQVVQSAIVEGRLLERFLQHLGDEPLKMSRTRVKSTLTRASAHEAILRAGRRVTVRDDADVWAVLTMLHGGADAGRKPKTRKGVIVAEGGALGLVSGHAKAALACCVAWLFQQRNQPC